MPPDIPQIQRQIRIVQLLTGGRRLTTAELYAYFDQRVSRRTLQRDLLALSAAHVPVVSRKLQANENEWWIDTRFRSFVRLPLSTNEYLAAHILRSYLTVFGRTPLQQEIDSLLRKLDQLVPEEVFLEIQGTGVETVFENFSAGTFDYAPCGTIINDLIGAILHRRRCRVTYQSPGEDRRKSYYIEPERMIYYNGGLYAIVYVRYYRQFIILAVQRILELTYTGETFPPDHPFDPEQFWKGKFGLFRGKPVPVKLRFSRDVVHHIDGRHWHPTQKISFDARGRLVLSLEAAITPELLTWILGWQRHVKVLKPQALLDEIRTSLHQTLKQYR